MGKYLLEDTLRIFKTKEDEMRSKQITSDAMHIENFATADTVLAKKSDP